jgi:hypothetical protein
MNCRIEGIINLLKRASAEIEHLADYSRRQTETNMLRVAAQDIEMTIGVMSVLQENGLPDV